MLPRSLIHLYIDILLSYSFKMAFEEPVSLSMICGKCLLFSQLKYIASSLLNTKCSFGTAVWKRNGGIRYSEHLSQFSEIFPLLISKLFYFLASIFNMMYNFRSDGCMKGL